MILCHTSGPEKNQAPKIIRRAVRLLIPLWQMTISVRTGEGTKTTRIVLKRGLFQGDSLSPLLFCLCAAPVSHILRKTPGFVSEVREDPVTHLMFMDDLKMYQGTPQQLSRAMDEVLQVSEDLGVSQLLTHDL